MSDRKIALIGAGSASFTTGLIADIINSRREDQWTIGLVDIDEQALDVAQRLAQRMVNNSQSAVKVEAAVDRTDILPGADIVVTTIAVGGREAWKKDILVPRDHGIFQPVGDTVGAGGISRAMRQIPAMIEIAHDVARLCPNAHFFNYANPMAAICRALNKHTPAHVIGLCHGVQGTLRYLCQRIDVPYDEIASLYVGINHLTWITHLTRDGRSLWPVVRDVRNSVEPDDNPFAWEMYDTYGAFPAVLDRHITEFFPERFATGDYYGNKLGVDVMNILDDAIDAGDERYQKMVRQARGELELDEGIMQRQPGEHEALIPIIESIYSDRQALFPMNVPNRTIDGIPSGFVLEMPVIAGAAGCLPVALPDVPPALLAWITEALYGVEITVEAAIDGDYDTLVQALLYDRCVMNLNQARSLADDLIDAHADHLPQFE